MNINVDDANIGIWYGGSGWYSQTNVEGEFNKTRRGVSPNVLQTMVAYAGFTFQGSFVAVYGSLDIFGTVIQPLGYSVQFNVDNGPPTTYTPPPLTVLQQGLQFYKSSPLSDGEHTLNFTITIPSTLGSSFWLDRIEYTPVSKIVPNESGTETITPVNTATLVSGIQSTAATTPSALIVPITTIVSSGSSKLSSIHESRFGNPSESMAENLSTQLSLTTSSSLPSTPSTPVTGSESKKPIGVIVGAVIGGVCLILLIAFGLYRWRRKRGVVIRSLDHGSSPVLVPFPNTPSPTWQGKGESKFSDEDSPPPWSPSESSDMQSMTASLLASNTLVGHTPHHSLINTARYYAIPGRSKSQHRIDGDV